MCDAWRWVPRQTQTLMSNLSPMMTQTRCAPLEDVRLLSPLQATHQNMRASMRENTLRWSYPAAIYYEEFCSSKLQEHVNKRV